MHIKTKMVSCHTADTKPVKHEVNGTMILPPLVFPGFEYFAQMDGQVEYLESLRTLSLILHLWL